MRWPWKQTHPDDGEQARADEALERTSEGLAETRRRDEAGYRLAERIRAMRERNHLAEAIEKALGEGR
ncbi:DUF7620 family protein [Actinomadura madurae]|uniref:DUF7620 family protein n=1 Tax=Actinomadura madurae TaxID=1993 RepID=UPI0020D1F6A1|nr:hypothetical protein [Actinomadura madurae]MCP9947290.1 hypothetical protein [Actinomadura madurae]MCP9976526.1 hypothetical protein [Actinomadura madurae]